MQLTKGFKRAGLGLALGCLVAASALAGDENTDLTQRFETLRGEFRTVERETIKARSAAETPEEIASAYRRNPWDGFRERFDAIAFEAGGTEVAAGAWSMVFTNELRYGTPDHAWEAFQVLVYDHSDSAELEGVVSLAKDFGRENEDVIVGLQYLRKESARKSVQAGALFGLAKILESKKATNAQALDYYREVIANFGDVEGPRKTFAEMAAPALYEAEYLQVGMQAPVVASIDETGTPFNLSDYAGKVVLLDFWGFW